jgi:hypothetical protein
VIGRRPRALPLVRALTAALAWFLPGAAWSDALFLPGMPSGLYAHVNIEDVLPGLAGRSPNIQINQFTTQPCAVVMASSSDQAALHVALQEFYMTLLSDEAISGITAGVHWCRVQIEEPDNANSVCPASNLPCYPDGNDWSYVDDVFTANTRARPRWRNGPAIAGIGHCRIYSTWPVFERTECAGTPAPSTCRRRSARTGSEGPSFISRTVAYHRLDRRCL